MRQAVTIVGGGMAGLSLGVGLRKRGVPVVIHEASSYPRHRVCGEFISGLDASTQAYLGITDLLADSILCQSTGWYHRGRFAWHKRLKKPALGMSRYLLDQRLAEHFCQLGGKLEEHSRIAFDEDAPGMVWTTGRRAESSDWMGLKFHCTNIELEHDLELHLGEGGYMGISKIENGKANVCGLFRKRPGLSASKQELPMAYLRASRLDNLASKVDSSTLDSSSIVGISHLTYGWKPASEGRLALGDQYMLIPPFTGNGMAMALQGAALAIEPLLAFSRREQSWETTLLLVRQQLRRRFRRRLAVSRCLHPLIFHRKGQPILSTANRCGLLPFNLLYNLTH